MKEGKEERWGRTRPVGSAGDKPPGTAATQLPGTSLRRPRAVWGPWPRPAWPSRLPCQTRWVPAALAFVAVARRGRTWLLLARACFFVKRVVVSPLELLGLVPLGASALRDLGGFVEPWPSAGDFGLSAAPFMGYFVFAVLARSGKGPQEPQPGSWDLSSHHGHLPCQALSLSKQHSVSDTALRLPRALALHRFRALTAPLFSNSAVSFTSRNQMKAALSPTASPVVVILTPFPSSPLRLSKAEPLILDLGR